ncbi:AAA domain-containing protein [Sulfobacillus thermosulfidooxidans DSM 9293]|uniref:AAA domain-containing protein n=1 Tax=Sulfobacillus thermosulfidooxidans (strain DSM 9293 / VKM B-1269 / AT-1) TaxID=929705 RepID=A0A1W1WCD9_SULTA|nr:AAA family ATPase [Sulfobacillus thermosulfidooxidans]SMC03839.1 AAA domain-containing protein [Sulfobacillus thermosulfidooxidans DSM 9293]
MNKMPSPLGLGSDYRIYLIGAPGSGKSFLAERLSHALHIAWHDLDGEDIDGGCPKLRGISLAHPFS